VPLSYESSPQVGNSELHPAHVIAYYLTIALSHQEDLWVLVIMVEEEGG
jgi:hypothetical protein